MQQPVFKTEGKNICNEIKTNNISTVIGNDRVLLNEISQHLVQDTIVSNIYPMQQNNHANQPFFGTPEIITVPFTFPGGVTFTFQEPHKFTATVVPTSTLLPQSQAPPQNIEQLAQNDYQTIRKQLEQQVLQNMLEKSHQQLKPYQLNFHFNAGTSTSDLYPFQQSIKTTQTELKELKEQAIECVCNPNLCGCTPTECFCAPKPSTSTPQPSTSTSQPGNSTPQPSTSTPQDFTKPTHDCKGKYCHSLSDGGTCVMTSDDDFSDYNINDVMKGMTEKKHSKKKRSVVEIRSQSRTRKRRFPVLNKKKKKSESKS